MEFNEDLVREKLEEGRSILLNYNDAVKYLTSLGISCDPCQSDEGEWVCELLDELYEDGYDDEEKYAKLFVDAIANTILTARQSYTK